VLALVRLQFLVLLGVAGEAGLGDVLAERDLEGSVRVGVARKAPFQLEVGFAFVAVAALGNVVR